MNAGPAILIAALAAASPALGAPKIAHLAVRPNPAPFSGAKPPEVEIAVSVTRGRFDSGGCDARVEFGDGEGRTVDFGVASTRTLRHVYRKGGSYSVLARGAGATPCEGMQQAALTVAGAPEPTKKPHAKKSAAKKKAAPAKKKPAAKKKAQPK